MGEPETAVIATDRIARRGASVPDGETAAWIVALPLALVAVPLIALLARPVGTLLSPSIDVPHMWAWEQAMTRPEPREQGMYLLSLAVPVVLAAAILLSARRAVAVPRGLASAGCWIGRVMLAALVVASLVAQYRLRYETPEGLRIRDRIFTPVTLVAGVLIAALIVAAPRAGTARRRIAAALHDTRGRRIAALALAATITALWMLTAVNSDHSVAWAHSSVVANVPYTADETFSLLDGRTPFVDLTPVYGALWPYLTALPLLAFGKTLLVFTLTMTAITTVAMLAGYGTLRRVTGSPVSGLLLFLPFLATSFFLIEGTVANRFTTAAYFADFPLRYAGPLLLAWLTARELDGDRIERHAPWALFAAGGLVAINNAGVGLPAFGATAIAIAATNRPARASWLRIARGAIGGVLVALAAVTLLTVVRAGALPDFAQALEPSRAYLAGFMATPLRSLLGAHLVIYLTYTAAIVTAAARLRDGSRERALNGMLLWSGVFGLGTFSYFIIESERLPLVTSFSTWAFTVMLLAVVVVRRLAARRRRWPDPAELAVLFGLGVMACSLAQLPAPWSQIARLTGSHRGEQLRAFATDPFVPDPAARPFVASLADGRRFYLQRGAPVALLFENANRLAEAYGVRNVSPFANYHDIRTQAALREIVTTLRRAGGNTVVTPASRETTNDLNAALVSLGFGVLTKHGVAPVTKGVGALVRTVRGEPLIKWVDLRNRHAGALRAGQRVLVTGMRG